MLEALEADPLLTQAPAKGFVKSHMPSGDYPSGLGVVDQVSVGVSGVANQDTLEGSICHLATLVGWDVDVGWAAEDSEVTQVGGMAIGQCHRDPVYSTVVDAIADVTSCQHRELLVA